MKILGIIPARGGSKGIPGKNIKPLGGKPLLQYTAEAAAASKLLSRVILSSDDEDILKTAKELNLEAPFIRPENISRDDTPSLEVIKHVLDLFEAENEEFEAVCLLQATTPFREKGFIDKAIQKFIEEDTDSLVSVLEVPAEYNPHWVFEAGPKGHLKLSTGEAEIISRRQELPKAYHRDGAIYLTKTNVLREQNSLFGRTISFIESRKELYVNIDTPADWELAEEIVKKSNF